MSASTLAATPVMQLRAAELMTPDVLTVYEGWSIRRLASFFVRHRISGAPVIASDHTLIGVVSLSDIARFSSLPEQDQARLAASSPYADYLGYDPLPEDMAWLTHSAANHCTVNSIMTRHVISVEEKTTLPQIARLMSAHGIHRVFVTRDGVVVGVVTAGTLLQQVSRLVE